MQIKPLIKGAITGGLIVIVSLVIYYSKLALDSPVNYLLYAIYAGGIAWTLWDYTRSPTFKPAFSSLFGQGFKCFIIVTLIVTAFVGITSAMHPEIAEEAAKYYREDLIKEKQKTPQQIDEIVEGAKKGFVTSRINLAIFSQLIIGAFFTAVGAGIVIMRKQMSPTNTGFINQGNL